MRKISNTQKITLGAMTVALSLLMLYAAAILPTMVLACYFFSSLFVFVLAAEKAYISAISAYLATSALGFLILPDKIAMIPYVFLFGHYGIFKTFLDYKIKDKVSSYIMRLLYSNFFFALAVIISEGVFELGLINKITEIKFPLAIIVLILEAAFILFDFLYLSAQKIYINTIRNHILPRR